VNKLGVPHFESVATTGLGVEETLKGITQLVLAHLVKKYGLEGSEPIERDIQILNATVAQDPHPHDSLWDEDDVFGEVTPVATPASVFTLDDASGAEDIPLVPTELIGAPPPPPPPPPSPKVAEPFDDFEDYFATPPPMPAPPPPPSSGISVRGGSISALASLDSQPSEVPMMSIEIPLPEGILSSLPDLEAPTERRASDGLVKEVTVPLNLTMDELRQHRRLRLKITLDVNLLS